MGARRVLVTGAEGVIGTAVREHLGARYELTSLTLTPQEFPSHVADIADLDAILPAFEDVDAVVHLAASAGLETPWDDVLHNNIVGTYNVFEAARLAGVSRVVFASSNHVIGMYELDGAPGALRNATTSGATTTRRSSGPTRSTASRRPTGRRSVGCTWSATACASSACGSAPCASTTTRRSPTANPLIDLDAEGRRNRLRAVWLSKRDCAELIAELPRRRGRVLGGRLRRLRRIRAGSGI